MNRHNERDSVTYGTYACNTWVPSGDREGSIRLGIEQSTIFLGASTPSSKSQDLTYAHYKEEIVLASF